MCAVIEGIMKLENIENFISSLCVVKGQVRRFATLETWRVCLIDDLGSLWDRGLWRGS